MMWRAVLLVAVAACHDQSLPPAGGDAGKADAAALECGTGTAIDHSVGCACNSQVDTFCAHYTAWCLKNECRPFCTGTQYPRCPAGEPEVHVMYMGADQCVCGQ